MTRYIVIGLLLFLAFGVAFLPASLATRALERVPGADLLQPAGTVWSGSGQLLIDGAPLGRVDWRFRPLRLLTATAAYAIELEIPPVKGEPGSVAGTIAYALGGELSAQLEGDIDCATLAPLLRRYEVAIDGRLTSEQLHASLDTSAPWETLSVDGRIDWSGGLTSYYLANTLARQRLQAMYANIETSRTVPREVQANVYGEESYPLLRLSLGASGFAKIGISKRLSQIVGSPWPGGDPDHAIVLEVEQPLF